MNKENPFDAEVEEYEAWFRANDKLLESELEAIEQLIPDNGGGIEIGVGTGIFASNLGIKCGVEPSEKMAAVARKNGVQVLIASAEKLPIEIGSYQFALMVTVDCFLDDVLKAFLEIKRILADKGYFIVAFLDRTTPLGKIYEKNKHLHRSYKDAKFHSANEIEDLLEKTGFKIIESKQTVYSLDNKKQEIKDGTGVGLFAVIKSQKL